MQVTHDIHDVILVVSLYFLLDLHEPFALIFKNAVLSPFVSY
jgi:hypothetical protein